MSNFFDETYTGDKEPDESIHARTSGEAEVEVVKADPRVACKEVDSSIKDSKTINAIMCGVIAVQLMFLAYMLVFSDESCESNKAVPAIYKVPEPEPEDYILIRTDEDGKILQHWEFKNHVFRNANRGWVFEKDDSRAVFGPMKHYIFLENPSPEQIQKFLGGKLDQVSADKE